MIMDQGLPVREALSGIFGSISLASWILVLAPQAIENFKNGSTSGLSTAFLLMWLAGDIANLIGSIWAGLLPTVIALAVYYCFADCVLLSQVFYYNYWKQRSSPDSEHQFFSSLLPHDPDTSTSASNPTQPLLSRRRSTSSQPVTYRNRSPSPSPGRKSASTMMVVTWNMLAIAGTCLGGALAWFVAWKSGVWKPEETPPGHVSQEIGAQVLGYISAVLYLGARIPQIMQNYRNKSCEGLSILFFMLSLLGNLTFAMGILFHSTNGDYVMMNLPWLIGSLGTMVEDTTIFFQFSIYGKT